MEIADVRQPRRIVTGHDDDGKSYLARVEEVDQVEYEFVLPAPEPVEGEPAPAHGGHGAPAAGSDQQVWGEDRGGFYRIWGSDVLPIPLPTDGRTPYFDTRPTPEETPDALRRATIMPPPFGVRIGWSRHPLPGAPGPLHWTDSTDILYFMSGMRGEILDEGELILKAGDVLIQNGTMHAHETVGDEPTVMGYVVVGALRTGQHPPLERLHRVSEPVGGHRPGEQRDKQRLAPWSASAPPPGRYEGDDRAPRSLKDLVRPRRVVTGTNAAGKSYYSRVEEVDEVDFGAYGRDSAGNEVWRIWGIDRLPDLVPTTGLSAPLEPLPSPEETPDALRLAPRVPPPLGLMSAIVRMVPTSEPGPMHSQDTMDVFFVMSGQLTQKLDGGDEIDLQPGDVMIQNGTTHSWHNRGSEPVMLGVASFAGVRFGAGT